VNDPFLEADRVTTEADAIKMSLMAALQRNKTYCDGLAEWRRNQFRAEWASLIRKESQRYMNSSSPVTDGEHCETIRRISEAVTGRFGTSLIGGRLRFGTSQKAFNLYLKYLWRLGKIATAPPHCPVDGIVLGEAGLLGSWTQCDDEREYMTWIKKLRTEAQPKCLADWEYEVWLRGALKQRAAGSRRCC